MVDVLAAGDQVIRGRKPRKRAKLIDEVSLIVVAAVQRYVRPVHVTTRCGSFDCLAEPHEPAIGLGRQAHLLAKYLDEAPLAETHAVTRRRDALAAWNAGEFTECETNRGMVRE